jgi:hypothetical protein
VFCLGKCLLARIRSIGINAEFHVRSDGLSSRGHSIKIGRRLAANLHFDHFNAPRGPIAQLLLQLGYRIGSETSAPIDHSAFSHRPEQIK